MIGGRPRGRPRLPPTPTAIDKDSKAARWAYWKAAREAFGDSIAMFDDLRVADDAKLLQSQMRGAILSELWIHYERICRRAPAVEFPAAFVLAGLRLGLSSTIWKAWRSLHSEDIRLTG